MKTEAAGTVSGRYVRYVKPSCEMKADYEIEYSVDSKKNEATN